MQKMLRKLRVDTHTMRAKGGGKLSVYESLFGVIA